MRLLGGRLSRVAVTAALLAAAVAAPQLAGTRLDAARATGPVVNGRIAYVDYVHYDGDIWTAKADGSDAVDITHDPSADQSMPVWSPDGSKIAFAQSATATAPRGLYVMDADGGHAHVVMAGVDLYSLPSWSPDSQRIAFSGAGSGPVCSCIVDADGTNLTHLPYYMFMPSWSPDGTKLAYTASDGSSEWISIAGLDGSGSIRVSPPGVNAFRPAWSPDGTEIAYQAVVAADTPSSIMVIDVDGSNQRRLADGSDPSGSPAWSADGQHILFRALSGAAVMDRDGSNLSYLGHSGDSSWGPRVDTPFVVVRSPRDDAVFDLGEPATAAFQCVANASPITSCTATGSIVGASDAGGALVTGALGDYSFDVTAVDAEGRTVVRTVRYRVKAVPPSVSVHAVGVATNSVPYGSSVTTTFSCAPGAGSELVSCDDSNGVTTASGGQGVLDTGTLGSHGYSVTAVDADGQKRTEWIGYTVTTTPPTAVIDGPPDGTTYRYRVPASVPYHCVPAPGAALVSCKAMGTETAPGEVSLETDAWGDRYLTVEATDSDGQTSTATFHYTVVADPPTATIESPADGGQYTLGEMVETRFSCQDYTGAWIWFFDCTDQYREFVGYGDPDGTAWGYSYLDTTTLGTHTYTVTAVDRGRTSSTSITYTVVAPPVPPLCHGLRATIVGSPRSDTITGTARRDVIVARGGNDRIRGLSGNDVICGGAGSDRIWGGAGADWVSGGAGNDVIVGGDGRDVLRGDAGINSIRR
ncbi:MAG TPA: hypothetical protein VJ872_03750 [Nocardioides sp.]|nr:hypothetical protein [Nocardioides sp.]